MIRFLTHQARKYATSKLESFEHLERGVSTFGFRGEALSSLCAMSQLSVLTRCASDQASPFYYLLL
jgi:DNA mismatch repair ATPase MutL